MDGTCPRNMEDGGCSIPIFEHPPVVTMNDNDKRNKPYQSYRNNTNNNDNDNDNHNDNHNDNVYIYILYIYTGISAHVFA